MLRLTSFIASLPSYFSPATLDESTGVHLFDDTEDLDDDAFEDDPAPTANALCNLTNATLESQLQQQNASVTSINLPASFASSSSPPSSSSCSSLSSSSPSPHASICCPNCQKHVQVSQTIATTLPLHQFAYCKCTNASIATTNITSASPTTTLNATTTTTSTSTTTTTTLQLRHSPNRNAMQLSNASRRRFASASFPSASSSSSSPCDTFNCEHTSQMHQIRRRSADDIAYFKEIGSYLRRVSEEFDRSSRSNLTNKFAITLTSISPSNSRSF